MEIKTNRLRVAFTLFHRIFLRIFRIFRIFLPLILIVHCHKIPSLSSIKKPPRFPVAVLFFVVLLLTLSFAFSFLGLIGERVRGDTGRFEGYEDLFQIHYVYSTRHYTDHCPSRH